MWVAGFWKYLLKSLLYSLRFSGTRSHHITAQRETCWWKSQDANINGYLLQRVVTLAALVTIVSCDASFWMRQFRWINCTTGEKKMAWWSWTALSIQSRYLNQLEVCRELTRDFCLCFEGVIAWGQSDDCRRGGFNNCGSNKERGRGQTLGGNMTCWALFPIFSSTFWPHMGTASLHFSSDWWG